MSMPNPRKIMNGLRRPKEQEHLSLSEPKNGVRKKPRIGEVAQTNVIVLRSIPSSRRRGETNAVSAA